MKTKRIDQIAILQHNELAKQQTSLTPCCPRRADIIAKYGSTAQEFLLTVTPSQQPILYKNIQDCYFGDYPTLGELNGTYTPKTAQAWLIPQLLDLSEYCGVKEKFTTNQLSQCSEIIANDYFYLKVSELMLFFSRFKRGCYGRFWGAVDPLIITEALKEFCRERNIAYYDQAEKEEENKLREGTKNSCTWEEYSESSGQKGKPLPSSNEPDNPLYAKIRKGGKKSNEEERILGIAKSLTGNLYKCDMNTLSAMKTAFRIKYGHTPEEYVSSKS